ncbi:MAG: peptidase S41 [Deltaproteobacteria bacterium RBG_13_58_19]|nr:MAG: peptidase S41 [Deltaproteobacteria bacterium RBG_13_58_19]
MLNRSRLWLIIPILLGLLLLLSQAPVITGSSADSASPPPPGQAVSKVAPVPLTPANDANLQVFAQALDLVGHNYVDAKTTKDLVYGSIQGVVSTLDPHSSFMNPDEFKELQIETKGKFSGIGIEITLKDRVLTVVSPIEGTPAYRAGLRAGDQILKINGTSTKNLPLTEAVKMIRGPKGSKVILTINRQGFTQPKDFSIVREIIPIRSVKARILDDGIGYIRLANFQDQTDNDLKNYLKKMRQRLVPFKGLILDLRNDPGGLLEQAVQVADEFLHSGLIVYTQGRNPQQSMRFYARQGQEGERPAFPLIVLINEGSASASEIVAGALKDQKRALIVGSKSFGKGSVQTIIPLEDGSALRLTTALYYTPSGQTIQDKGIIPDIIVKEPDIPEDKTVEKLREEALDRHMRKEGITDKAWDQPLTANDLNQDPVLKQAVDLLRHWPPKNLAQQGQPPS